VAADDALRLQGGAFCRVVRISPESSWCFGLDWAPWMRFFGSYDLLATRLATAYGLNQQSYEAQKIYEWVLSCHDGRFASVELAAAYEDNGTHGQALRR
jgi:hypothetical protein